jgi:acyl-CoA synthetase (AMP-forming)/AMP-acid ligase II
MPKGVMWRQGDLLARGGYGANPAAGLGPWSEPAEAGPRAAAQASRVRSLIPCPLMHGTGLIAALSALNAGGTVILPPPGRFDAERLWDVAARRARRGSPSPASPSPCRCWRRCRPIPAAGT